jgi:2-desacetyl-2-hydroxyethyl bacteriochlorophyllide A dehydrogenase
MNEPRTMRAARLMQPQRIEIETTTLPEPGPGEVRIRIEGCGVCGSNLTLWRGLPGLRYPLAPGEPGHEAWGRVDRLGSGVQSVRIGERCAFLSPRAFAEYVVTDAATLVAAPPETKIFPGEALGCAFNIYRRADIHAGHTVAIIGVGFLGALLVRLAARAGVRVIALSQRPFALDLARRMGAVEALSMEDPQTALHRFMELTGGKACERVIEAAGTQASLDVASELVATYGKLIIAGYHQDGPRQVNLQSWNWRGIDIINAHERALERCVAGMRDAAADVASGALDPAPLYTHAFRLEDCAAAFETLASRPPGFVKAWIQMDNPERPNA